MAIDAGIDETTGRAIAILATAKGELRVADQQEVGVTDQLLAMLLAEMWAFHRDMNLVWQQPPPPFPGIVPTV